MEITKMMKFVATGMLLLSVSACTRPINEKYDYEADRAAHEKYLEMQYTDPELLADCEYYELTCNL
jgi:hypothetical protein